MVERLISKEIPHGPISIAFTPDEKLEVVLSILISSGLMLILLILWMAIPRVRSSLKILMPVKLSLKSLVLMYILVLRRIR